MVVILAVYVYNIEKTDDTSLIISGQVYNKKEKE